MSKKGKTARFELVLSEEEKERLLKKAGSESGASWLRAQINAPFEDTHSRALKEINERLEAIEALLKKEK